MATEQTPYSYDAQQIDIKRKRAIAEALAASQLPQGQMFSNAAGTFYGGGTTSGMALGHALSKMLAAYQNKQADEDHKANDAKSREEQGAAWNQYLTEGEQERALRANPAIYKSTNPMAFGPSMEELTGVETTPVRPQSPMVSRDLPPSQPQPQAKAAPTPVPQTPSRPALSGAMAAAQAQREAMGNPEVAAMNVGQYNSWKQNRINELMASQAPAQAPAQSAQAQGALAPALAAQQAPGMPAPTADQQAYAAVTAPKQAPGQVVDEEAAKGVLANLMDLKQQRERDALERLHASGPRGKAQVEALEAMQLQRMAKGKGDDEFVTTSLGDGQFITTNKRTGEVKTGGPGAGTSPKAALDQNEFVLKVRKELVPLEQQVTEGQTAIDKIDRFISLNSKYGAHGGVLSSVAGSIGKAFGSDAANEYDMAGKDVKASLLKQVFGGSPTEGERKYLDDVFGAYSAGKVPTERAMMQLREAVQARVNTNKKLAGEYSAMLPKAPAAASAQAAPAASKSGLDWMPAR